MYCRYCGKEIDNSAAFCKYCGKSLKAAPNGNNESKTAREQAPKTNLNARILNTLEKEFHIDADREIRNFTTFHTLGYWWPTAGILLCVAFSFIVSGLWIYILQLVFVAWLAVFIVRIYRSAFGITDTSLLVRIWPSQTYEIPLDQIENVSVSKSSFSRSDICGDLQITTKEKTFYFRSVGNAEAFKNTLIQQLNETAKRAC